MTTEDHLINQKLPILKQAASKVWRDSSEDKTWKTRENIYQVLPLKEIQIQKI